MADDNGIELAQLALTDIDPQVKYLLQYNDDYFDHFEDGYHGNWRHSERRDVFEDAPVPRWNPARPDPALTATGYPNLGLQALAEWNRTRARRAFRTNRRRDDGAGRTVDDNIRRGFALIGLRMVKILGAGSQGLAVLFEQQDGRKIVLKWSTEFRGMVPEMWTMRRMLGARHIIQRRYPNSLNTLGIDHFPEQLMNMVLAGSGINTVLREILGLERGESKFFVYAMEFMKHGSLNGLLRRIDEGEVRLQSAQLWRVFHCLFRACVALAYPGRWDQGLDPEAPGVSVPTQEEFAPQPPESTENGIINLDINDRNVMIGDYDFDGGGFGGGHTHDSVPVVKVGDLGIIRAFRTPEYRSNMTALLRARPQGNPRCHTPEQFTQSWRNYVDFQGLSTDETAGKFGWGTNLWQVAQLMNMMMFKTDPDIPLTRLDVVKITRNLPDIPPACLPVAITKPDGRTDQVFTYGSHFLWDEYDHYDPVLRSTLAWCMAHRPADRPTMLELEGLFQTALATAVFPGDDDEDRITIGELLGSPPPPRPVATPVEGTSVVTGTSSVARSRGLRSRVSTALRSIRRGTPSGTARGTPSPAGAATPPVVPTRSRSVVRVPETRDTTDEADCFNCLRRHR